MNTKTKLKIQNTLKNKLQQVKPQKIGAVITVLLFGLICAIGGYEINSATSGASSVLPIAKGGTGANNAVTARTNLGIYSNTETDTAINNFAGWKNWNPNVSGGQNTPTFVRLIDNISTWSYLRQYYFDFYYTRFGMQEVGKMSIMGEYTSTSTRKLNNACFSSIKNTSRASTDGYSNIIPLAVGMFEKDGIYSIWLRLGYPFETNRNQYIRMGSARKAYIFIESGMNSTPVDILLDSATRTEPEGLQNTWIDVRRECSTQNETPPDLPTPTPTTPTQ
jgi:hypothetical protein